MVFLPVTSRTSHLMSMVTLVTTRLRFSPTGTRNLATVAGQVSRTEQLANPERWAREARPADCAALHMAGFGIAGFQYLRMLFGANTTKPDIHICRYVSNCIDCMVSDTEALQLLEQAALEAGVLLRDLDTTIWERSARGSY